MGGEIRVRVLFFASLRDLFGQGEKVCSLPAGATLGRLAEEIFRGCEAGAEVLKCLRFGVNQDFAPMETLLRDDDEVALLPPLSGG
ncbi:MAG TPA: MoaD/ThiS family protein [bacterium]|nr:MoaD/ThiS family protein [bacterium]